jgi:hypothetical protein
MKKHMRLNLCNYLRYLNKLYMSNELAKLYSNTVADTDMEGMSKLTHCLIPWGHSKIGIAMNRDANTKTDF